MIWTFAGAFVEITGLAIDGEGVGDVGSCTGSCGSIDYINRICVPPFAYSSLKPTIFFFN